MSRNDPNAHIVGARTYNRWSSRSGDQNKGAALKTLRPRRTRR